MIIDSIDAVNNIAAKTIKTGIEKGLQVFRSKEDANESIFE